MLAEIAEQRRGEAGAAGTQNRILIFIAALASVFITAIESTIVATAMPTIVATLGGFDLLGWVFTSYLLTQVVTIPIYGRLSDLYGRKPILLIGVGLFILGSILCGFAWSMLSLVCFRVLQGLGAGALVPVGRTLIGDIFHGEERARMQGIVSSVFIAAALVGPMVGAFIATHWAWPMIFWINVPIAMIAGAILIWCFHERIEKRRHRIDWGGAVLICVGTGDADVRAGASLLARTAAGASRLASPRSSSSPCSRCTSAVWPSRSGRCRSGRIASPAAAISSRWRSARRPWASPPICRSISRA